MLEENIDQVQEVAPAEQSTEQPVEQSETTIKEGVQEESNLFELSDGWKLAGDQLKDE